MEEDIRWKQRFSNYKKALEKLKESVEYIRFNFQEEENAPIPHENIGYVLSEMIKEGLIQRFEYTHEIPTSCRTPSPNDHWGFHMTNKNSRLYPAH